MLYLVMIQNTVIYKGNYYECLEYIDTLEVGQSSVSIRPRK